MKIVIATPMYPPQLGGPAKYAKELAKEFVTQGHEPRVVCYGALERALPTGVRHAVYFLRVLARLPGAGSVLALDTWSVGLPAAFAARLLGKRTVVRIGGDYLWESWVARTGQLVRLSAFYAGSRDLSVKERLVRWGTRWLVVHVDVLAFTTAWQQELWRAAYGATERTHVVENFYPVPAAASTSTPDQKVFVAAGRDTPLKNISILRKAFTRVAAANPGLVLDERVLHPVAHAKRLATAYAVLIPSVSEISPNTAIEAAAARKPFVGPGDCGNKDRLGGAGLFVDTTDEAALAAAITRLLDPVVYQACVAASAHVPQRPWGMVAAEYAALLKPYVMRLLVIGPTQSALAQSPAGQARRAMQEALVDRYVVYAPNPGEHKLAAAWRMLRQSRRESFDTVSSQDPFFIGCLAWCIARRAGATFNVQVHADLASQSWVRHLLAGVVLRHADSVRVVSERIKKQVQQMGVTVPIHVLPLYVDVERYKEVQRKPDGKTIVWVGRFEDEKDPLLAVSILAEVRKLGVDARLVMLGQGSLLESIRQHISRLNLGAVVELVGWQDPLLYFANASAVLSTSKHESYGVSMIEALAAGVPVVAPDVGVAREAGAIVVPRKALAGAVAEVLRTGVSGTVQLPLLAKEEWAQAWRKTI